MSEVCPKCGLNKELCVCETIAKEEQRISIIVLKKRFGKLVTIVEGINEKDINVKELAKQLKSKFACGGTSKKGKIVLQGDHAAKVKDELIKLGFTEGTIDVVRR